MADLIFTCYARLPAGDLRRLEVIATCDLEARRLAFEFCPLALGVTCRAGLPNEERRHG